MEEKKSERTWNSAQNLVIKCDILGMAEGVYANINVHSIRQVSTVLMIPDVDVEGLIVVSDGN